MNFTAHSKSYLRALVASQELQSPVLLNVKTITAPWSCTTFWKDDSQSPDLELVSSLTSAWVCENPAAKSHTLQRNQGPWFFLIVALDLSLDPSSPGRQLRPSFKTYLIPYYKPCTILDGTHPCSVLCVSLVNRQNLSDFSFSFYNMKIIGLDWVWKNSRLGCLRLLF